MATLAAGMAAIGGGLQIAGGYEARQGYRMSASAARLSGSRTRIEKQFEAQQLEQNAGQVVAASQRDAAEVQRQTSLVESRARAVAAASGGSLADAGIIDQVARLSNVGAYQKAVALYQGEDKARSMRMEASAKRYEGELAEELSSIQGAAYDKAGNAALLAGFAGAASGNAGFLKSYG